MRKNNLQQAGYSKGEISGKQYFSRQGNRYVMPFIIGNTARRPPSITALVLEEVAKSKPTGRYRFSTRFFKFTFSFNPCAVHQTRPAQDLEPVVLRPFSKKGFFLILTNMHRNWWCISTRYRQGIKSPAFFLLCRQTRSRI